MKRLLLSNGAIGCNKAYFVCFEANVILKMDLFDLSIDVLDSYPDENFDNVGLFGNLLYVNNKLVLVPLMANRIWIFDIATSKWDSINLDESINGLRAKFFGAIPYDKYVYLLGHYYEGIIRLDLSNKSIELIPIHISRDIENDGLFMWDYCMDNNLCYIPSLLTNQVYILNLENGSINVRDIGSNKNRYAGITWDGQFYWLAPRRNGSYVRWDGKDGFIEFDLPNGFENDEFYFLGVYMDGDEVVFPGMIGKSMTLRFNKESPTDVKIINEGYSFYKSIDDTQILQDRNANLNIRMGDKIISTSTEIKDSVWNKIRSDRLVRQFKKKLEKDLFFWERRADDIILLSKSI